MQDKFSSKNHLAEHVQTVHEGEKPHECQDCKKTFGTKSNLQVHLNTVHKGLKPFQCSFCDESFGESGTLKVFKMKKNHTISVLKKPFSLL